MNVMSTALVVVAAIVAGSVVADQCAVTVPSQFFMITGATGDPAQDTYQLYYAASPNPTQVRGTEGPQVSVSCMDEAKSMTITTATGWVAAYSNPVGGSGFSTMKMDDACAKQVLFNIRLDSTFRYVITNSSGDCLAMVADTPDSIVDLSSCDGTKPYAQANLTWSETPIQTPIGTFPYHASYRVTITDPTVSSLWILTMMSVKRNGGMECTPTSPPAPAPPSPPLSDAAVIVIAVLISGFVAVGVFLGLRRYYKRIDYAQMRQTLNENHEG